MSFFREATGLEGKTGEGQARTVSGHEQTPGLMFVLAIRQQFGTARKGVSNCSLIILNFLLRFLLSFFG